MIKRSDVVGHITDVFAQLRKALLIAGLESKEVGNVGLCTLDPRTENRLDANVMRRSVGAGLGSRPTPPSRCRAPVAVSSSRTNSFVYSISRGSDFGKNA